MQSLNQLTQASPQITVSWPSVFTVDAQQNKIKLNTDSLDVQFTNFGDLLNFRDFSADDIVDMLQEVAKFLGTLAKDTPFFKDKLPVIGKSPAELLGFVNKFIDAVQAFKANPDKGLNDLETQINTQLGPEFGHVDLSLDLSGAEPAVKIELPFTFNIATAHLPLDFDLDSLGVPGLKDLVDFQAMGTLDVNAGVAFDLAVGMEIVSGHPRAFLYDNDTSFNTTLKVAGTNFDFKAALGPFGIAIDDGKAALDIDGLGPLTNAATAGLTLTDGDGDGRHYLNHVDAMGKLVNDFGAIIDDLDFSIVGKAGIDLPINTLAHTPLDTSSPANASLKVVIPDLNHPLTVNVANSPNFTQLLSNLDFGNGIDGIIAGIDGLLALLENVLDGEVFGVNLPFIGDKLKNAATFIGDLRSDLVSNLQGAGGTSIVLVQQAIFDAVGPGNLDFLLDTNNDGSITIADVQLKAGPKNGPLTVVTNLLTQVNQLTDTVQFNVKLGSDLINFPIPLDLDLGIPGLGLDIAGKLQVGVGFAFNLGFGISKTDGVFFDVSNANELLVNVDVALMDLMATGQLGPLQLDVTQMTVAELDDPNDAYTHDALNDPLGERARSRINIGTVANPEIVEAINALRGRFSIDIGDGAGGNGRLGLDEIGSVADSIHANLAAVASLHLNAMASLGGDSNFPSIGSEIHLYWGFDNIANFGDSSPTIEFRDVGLNMGEFITNFFGGALGVVQDIVEPLQPILDVLTAPLPVLSELSGQTVTLVDIARVFGLSEVADFIDAVDTISDLVNLPSLGNDLIIPLGGFTVTFVDGNPELTKDNVASVFDLGDAVGNLGGASGQAAKDYFGAIPKVPQGNAMMPNPVDTKGKFDFPILNDPLMIFQLLLGKQDITLVTYDMPPASFGFEYSQYFPIFGPLGARIGGEVGFNIDLAFGFDTQGFFDFSRTLNVLDIFNGFYVSDTASPLGTGEDVPEMQLFGALKAAAELNLGLASASVGGGVFLTIDFNLHDIPDDKRNVDGKIRIPEIVENFLVGPIYVFDISGKIEAGLEATLSALGISKTFEIAKVTLLDFDIPRPAGPQAPPEAILATVSNGVLTVNVGPNAGARMFGDTTDGNDNVLIRRGATDNQVIVVAFGLQQTYDNVTGLFINAGMGNDMITLDKNFSLPATLIGGAGNDIITGAKGAESISGGAGNDKLLGNDGNDTINGDAGLDTIQGAFGDDLLNGGDEADSIDGAVGADTINAGAGNDNVTGGTQDDVINGDAGNDKLYGGRDGDVINGGEGADSIFG